jgi:deoxyribonuclease-4
MTHYFGAHFDMDNLVSSAKEIKEAGGNLIQIYFTLPGSIKATKKNDGELNEFKEYLKNNDMKVVVHSSYTHNIARSWSDYSWWIQNIMVEMKYSYEIDSIGLVLHLGKQLDLSKEEAYNNMYSTLLFIINKTKDYYVPIFLETSTGQGSEMCYKLEDFAHFYKKFSHNPNKELKNKVKICIDTCHIFAAGYDIRTKELLKNYIEAFEELIGLRYVALIHLNDCKVGLGEQRDRHNNIGKGYIGLEGLQYFYSYFKSLGIPIVLETPNFGYRTEISLLLNYNK